MKKRLTICAALVLLAAALIYYNIPSPAEEAPLPDAAIGSQVGQRPPDFTLPCLGGGDFTLSAQRGKVTVINLWATWCGPCVKELPYFDQYMRAHPGEVSFLAIHSDLVTEDVETYLAHYDYALPFAVDESGAVIASLGGSAMLPQTIILTPAGVVAYNQVGSMSYDALEDLILQAREM